MKKVCLYNPYWSSLGGGEKYVCSVAGVLSSQGQYDVTILTDTPAISRERLSTYFHVDLDKVTLNVIPRGEIVAALSSADIGIVLSNFRSFGNLAGRNVSIVQVPYPGMTPTSILSKAFTGSPKEAVKDIFRRSLLRDARRADLVLVYSEFSRRALRDHHHIEADVLYPPIDDFKTEGKKEHVILSVGRFFRGLYNDKRYDVLIRGFKEMRRRFPNISWEYRLVGSCGADAASQRYVAMLRETARGDPIYFYLNVPYEELRRHYNEATLFWHATGFDVDESVHPDRMEHFGMSTVEAMSAECVPVVIDKGGQKEIVSHRESGYRWHTVDELIEHSMQLMTNQDLLTRMQAGARTQFKQFDRQHFFDRLVSLFQRFSENAL
jgi:glycosyltransferase involved in cell wall biosynthesis